MTAPFVKVEIVVKPCDRVGCRCRGRNVFLGMRGERGRVHASACMKPSQALVTSEELREAAMVREHG